MSRFEDKFSEAYGKKRFLESEAQKGWESLGPQLDAKFPISGPSGSTSLGGGLTAIAIGLAMSLFSIGFYSTKASTGDEVTDSKDAQIAGVSSTDFGTVSTPSESNGKKSPKEGSITSQTQRADREELISTQVHNNTHSPISKERIDSPVAPELADSKAIASTQTTSSISSSKELPQQVQALPKEKVLLTEKSMHSPSNKQEGFTDMEGTGVEGQVILASAESSPSDVPQRTSIDHLSLEEVQEKFEQKTQGVDTAHKKEPSPEIPIIKNQPTGAGYSQFYLGLASEGYSQNRDLSGGNPLWIQERITQESIRPVLTLGIYGGWSWNSNWAIETGLTISSWSEEMVYPNSLPVDTGYYDSRWGRPEDHFTQIIDIDSVRVVDSIYTGHYVYSLTYQSVDSTVIPLNRIQSFSYVELPLTLRYSYPLGSWKPFVSGGLVLGLPRQNTAVYRGVYENTPVAYSFSTIQYSISGQLGVEYA